MDSIYPILSKGHSGFAMLLVMLAALSFLFALLTTVLGPKGGVLKVANVVGIAETAIAGLVTLSGLVAMFVGPIPLSSLWLWAGLVLVVIYSIFSKRVTKPARLAAAGGGGSMKWIVAVLIHIIIVVIAFGLMKAKPF